MIKSKSKTALIEEIKSLVLDLNRLYFEITHADRPLDLDRIIRDLDNALFLLNKMQQEKMKKNKSRSVITEFGES